MLRTKNTFAWALVPILLLNLPSFYLQDLRILQQKSAVSLETDAWAMHRIRGGAYMTFTRFGGIFFQSLFLHWIPILPIKSAVACTSLPV